MNPTSQDNSFGSFGPGGTPGGTAGAGGISSGAVGAGAGVSGAGFGTGGAGLGVGGTGFGANSTNPNMMAAGGQTPMNSSTGDIILGGGSTSAKKSKKWWWIGGGIATIVFLGCLIVFLFSNGSNKKSEVIDDRIIDKTNDLVGLFIYGTESQEKLIAQSFEQDSLNSYYAFNSLGNGDKSYYDKLESKVADLNDATNNSAVIAYLNNGNLALNYYYDASIFLNNTFLISEYSKIGKADLLAQIDNKISQFEEGTELRVFYEYLRKYLEQELEKYDFLSNYNCIDEESINDECVKNLDDSLFNNELFYNEYTDYINVQADVMFRMVVNEWKKLFNLVLGASNAE